MRLIENEDEVLSALKSGDQNAFKTIYLAYYDKLCRYANSLSNNTTNVEDIVQEALMYLWQKREDITINSSLNAYLYRAVYNRFIGEIKKNKRELTLMYELQLSAILEFESFEDSKKEHYLQLLEDIISKLPEKRKEVFVLSKIKNYKYKEIASMLKISERTVENQIRRAFITIRKEVSGLKYIMILAILEFYF
ncbi:RNA polymerase sigma factor [Flavivirga rizhaonensis]|uniref:RNA polymerase sigma-70 factor n=1 Tax=Flavivirga rizhaonensis TaxID=2559571 RepID=A0A4S1DW66_9FLAO|nr:RNA polymerase sigma-70 factor [Flavivirga rizhaonensis]TGV02125.1 RNA polymerase sigma-70 factor [Flavivirga rizhaonensis]